MRLRNFFRGFLGTKAFYSGVLTILVPLVVQQGITSFVNLLDNLMVGQLGTESISSVAIVNQLIFVFSLTVFGGIAGVSIFGAQFYGKKDTDGLRYSLRLRLIISITTVIIFILIMVFYGEMLISFFINETEGESGNVAETMELAKAYMNVALWGMVPFAISQCFASVLKDTGETVAPMKASVIAILTNMVLNYILIFGKLGMPALGVEGAAIATVIARYMEMLYIIWFSFKNSQRFSFFKGAFSSLRIPMPLAGKIMKTTLPLLVNELLWSLGTTAIVWCYSIRGLNAVTAVNINNTVWQVFSIIMMAMGNAIGIMTGQLLGANDIEGAKDTAKKLLFFDVTVNLFIGLLIIALAPAIPAIYNTSIEVKELAKGLLIVSGIVMPIDAYTHGTYFTIRSGGKTVITFLFDCLFTWIISIPIAWLLINYTGLSLIWIFFAVQAANIIKVIIGTVMVKSGIWAKNVVKDM